MYDFVFVFDKKKGGKKFPQKIFQINNTNYIFVVTLKRVIARFRASSARIWSISFF